MPEEAASPAPEPVTADDQAVRQHAVYADHSVLVRAPAGSGKTELLIQRFLRLLATVDEPEAILALTFSRKAAGEMHQRLLAALDAADGAEPREPHQRGTWTLARAARRRDADRGWNVLQSPARLRVMTFDGLALSLLQRTPWLARGDLPLQPTEDAAPLYQAAARATLERIEHPELPGGAAARRLLRHLQADVDTAAGLVAGLLEKRDQWIGWLGAAHGQSAALRELVRSSLTGVVQTELELTRGRLAGAGLPLPEAAAWLEWQALADTVLTKAGAQRKAYKTRALTDAQCAALDRVRALPDPAADLVDWDMTEALLELLPVALAALQVVFAERGECDFTALSLAAVESLGDENSPSGLAAALDARLQHLFVDEFQDTSRAQYALLERLLADWDDMDWHDAPRGDGRTLFVVGDAMQSIYGFRDADVRAFLQAAAEGRLGPVRLEVLALTENYRSQPEVIAWCNLHFGAAAGLIPSPVGFKPAGFPAGGVIRAGARVSIHAVPGHNPETEARMIADAVEAELTEPDAGGEIAILVQNRGHLRAILSELQTRNITYQGARLSSLADSPVVSDLLALARALADPADRIAWLALLRAPWCGLTLADLHILCADDKQATVAELWAERQGDLTADGRERAARLMQVAGAAARQFGRIPLFSLVAWCWRELDGARLAGERAADAAPFLDRLRQACGRRSAPEWAALETSLGRLHAPPKADDRIRVRIMTAHQAKGLQFDTVILPRLGAYPAGNRSELLRWLEAAPHFLLAPRAARGAGDNSPVFAYLGERNGEQAKYEQLRLLYVAATRAERRLHLFAFTPTTPAGDIKKPDVRSPLARLWPTLTAEFRRQHPSRVNLPFAVESTTGAEPAAEPSYPRYPRLRRVHAIPERPRAPEPEPAGETPGAARFRWQPAERERAIGIVVHALLQALAAGTMAATDSDAIHGEIERRLRLAGEWSPAAAARARQAVDATLADERGRWILAPDHDDARCEWAITGVLDGVIVDGVVDRGFVAGGVRWVVDYKTAAPRPDQDPLAFLDRQAEGYRDQLARYVRLLRQFEPRPVRCGLYFPLLPAWREVAIPD